MNGLSSRAGRNILFPLVVVIATMYLAREFLIPLALAILVSFLLAPLVYRLDHWHFGRVTSVLTATLLMVGVVAGIGFAIGGQLVDLAKEIPQYETNLHKKIAEIKLAKNRGALSRLADTVKNVSADIRADSKPAAREGAPSGEAPVTPEKEGSSQGASQKEDPSQKAPDAKANSQNGQNQEKSSPTAELPASGKKPVPVTVVSTSEGSQAALKTYAEAIFAPLGRAALVLLLVIFFLLEREDMRDRLIHLIGRSHLQVTTLALDEAAQRVSRYLLAQLCVNVVYGILIGTGLYFIGIPNAILWGMLATILRFVPYVGPWIAASFPLVLSLAISPKWTTPLMTFGLFLAVEILVANALEPWLYGSSTGMSPIAVIAAAAFWTWLWGPIGLLLAVPLTVCIVVLGKYIPSLSFLDVLLGDKPPIAAEDRIYQRLLAGDQDEACELIEACIEKESLGAAFQELIIPALRLADEDSLSGALNETDRCKLLQNLHDLVSDLNDSHTPTSPPAGATPPELEPPVLCIPASDLADEIACIMLARLLAEAGIASRVIPSKLLASEMLDEVARSSTRQFCVSVIPPGSTRQATYVCKRLRDRFPDARILVGMWGESSDDDRRIKRVRRAKVDVVLTSLVEGAREIVGAAPVQEAVAPLPAQPSSAPVAA